MTIQPAQTELQYLANWCYCAAIWLTQEVGNSRRTRPAANHRTELVAFVPDELDALLSGLQETADLLQVVAAMQVPPAPKPVRRRDHLQVVKKWARP